MLELDKLLAEREAAGSADPSATLLQDIRDKKESEEANADDADGLEPTDDADAQPEESGNPEPADPEAEAAEDTEDEGDDKVIETEGAAKSWLLSRDRIIYTESFEEGESSYVSAALGGAITGVKYLAGIGMKYGPGLFRGAYRIVATTAVQTSKLLYVGAVAFNRFMKRRRESSEKLRRQISDYREALTMVQGEDSKRELEGDYTNVKLMSDLITSEHTEVSAAIQALTKTVSGELTPFVDDVIKEIRSLAKTVEHFDLAKYTPDEDDLEVTPPRGFEPRVTSEQNPVVKALRLKSTFPGAGVLEYDMPAVSENNTDTVGVSYRAARMRVAVDKTHYVVVDQKPYLSLEEIGAILDDVEALLNVSDGLEARYRMIMSEKGSMRKPLRLYFNKIFTADKRLHLQASMLDVVYLKTMLIDKVYLIGIMDTHDYVVGVAAKALRLVNDHIRAYA